MHKFAFIVHPLELEDISRKFSFTKWLPAAVLERLLRLAPPIKTSEITGIVSPQGAKTQGYFIGCCLTSKQMKELPQAYVMNKIIKAGQKAQEMGAEIVGLGAFTAVVGDAGVTIAKHLNIPVTTGNSYTVYTALEGTRMATQKMGLLMEKSQILIIGATGSIGAACARILAPQLQNLLLMAPDREKLRLLVQEIQEENPSLHVTWGTDLHQLLPQAQIVISASGSFSSLINAQDLRKGAIVCDVARPRDVAAKVAEERKDVLIIDGGIVKVPGNVEFNFDFGFPPGTCYACMAETMILSLEGRLESYTLGRNISVNQITAMGEMAKKHGFYLSGLRSFEREVTLDRISKIREMAEMETVLMP